MQTAVGICNLSQDLLGAEALASIDAPVSANEKRYARQYPAVRDAELRKRKWNFTKTHISLTPTGVPIVTDTTTLYRYQLPGDCLYAIRESTSRWKVAAQQQILWEENGTLRVWIVARVAEAYFDALFVPVLAAALAKVLCEPVTQSNEKKNDANRAYREALDAAAVANSFEVGPENIADDDSRFSWVYSRYA